jgi:hypothetical protein
MSQIFGVKSLNGYLTEREQIIVRNINSLSKGDIDRIINIESYVTGIEKDFNINVPTINKDNITTDIEKSYRKGFTGNAVQFDIAVYKIPFEGNQTVFSLMPFSYTSGVSFEYSISDNKYLIIKVDSGGIITTKQMEEKVSNLSQQYIGYIESSLTLIKRDIEQNDHNIKDRIRGYLDRKMQENEKEKQLKAAINPFSKKI